MSDYYNPQRQRNQYDQNGFPVSPTGYFVYCNGDATRSTFDNKLHFDVKIIPYTGDDVWVEPTIHSAHTTLNANTLPPPGAACDYCAYREATRGHE